MNISVLVLYKKVIIMNNDSLFDFAAAQGFTFSPDELQNALIDVQDVLSEEELSNAVGGGNDKGNKGNGNGNGGDPNASPCSFYYNN